MSEGDFRAILERHQKNTPVKLGALAADLGIEVLIADLPAGISGKLTRESIDPERWTIRVNRHEHKNRQRFTIAHEIAHFILHRKQIGGELVDDTFYRSGLSERREWEANKLAAEILMPWSAIRALTDRGFTSVNELAAQLGVSESAMSIRLGMPT